MSYEGYSQFLCSKGHLWMRDCYAIDYAGKSCPICQNLAVWENMVDITNGSEDDEGNRIDGYIDLEINKPAVICKCDKCGIEHTVEPETYKLPGPDARERTIAKWKKDKQDDPLI